MSSLPVEVLGPEDVPEILDVFCDAFSDYPVMKYVLGPGGNTHARLEKLIGYFVARRVRLGGPLFGLRDPGGTLLGVATVTVPIESEPPPDLLLTCDRTFESIGVECRARHENYAAAAALFGGLGPHHHLNMLGVRRIHHGRGLGRPLIEAVLDLARKHTSSTGVSLTTEVDDNVRLYEHFAFEVVGRAQVDGAFETRGLFWRRP
ncbi:MAG TPA: GNAT family N-acetyltransferase [Vicinamibacterales bacterium]|nr:GNAT family N-acetyltransferase [Vicinamibacterales bacterium]